MLHLDPMVDYGNCPTLRPLATSPWVRNNDVRPHGSQAETSPKALTTAPQDIGSPTEDFLDSWLVGATYPQGYG